MTDLAERFADLFMDLRLSGESIEGWTYQQTARHYGAIFAREAAAADRPDVERLARMLADDEKDDPHIWGLLSDAGRDQFRRHAQRLIAREYAALEATDD